MRMKQTRAWIGYDPKSVHDFIQSLNSEFERAKTELEREIAAAEQELAELKNGANGLGGKPRSEEEQLKAELAELLVEAHLEATRLEMRRAGRKYPEKPLPVKEFGGYLP